MNTEHVGESLKMVGEVEGRSLMSRRAGRLDLRSLGETYSFIIITELASPWPGRRNFTQILSKPPNYSRGPVPDKFVHCQTPAPITPHCSDNLSIPTAQGTAQTQRQYTWR